MTLIKCPHCNKDIESTVTTCNHCGYPITLMGKSTSTINTQSAYINGKNVDLTKVHEFLKNGSTLGAMKELIAITDLSLKETKEYIDSINK